MSLLGVGGVGGRKEGDGGGERETEQRETEREEERARAKTKDKVYFKSWISWCSALDLINKPHPAHCLSSKTQLRQADTASTTAFEARWARKE